MNQPATYQDALATAEYDSLINAAAAAQSDAEVAKYQLQQAWANNDLASAAEAQERLTRAQSRLVTLEAGKEALDERFNQQQPQQQYRQQPQATATEVINQMTSLSAKEREWMMQHQDLLDPAMPSQQRQANIVRLQGAWFDAQAQGIRRDSDEYFRMFDQRFPNRNPQLTDAQRQHAKYSGVTNEVYAENLAKLKRMKEEGYYKDG
jgi:hypothetical protein